jgi:hypothetical protein
MEFASYTIAHPLTGVAETIPAQVLAEFALAQNFPNPFNPSTIVRYSLPVQAFVTLTVYNLLGQEVAVLVNETQEPGNHSTLFSDPSLPSGTYFYRVNALPGDGSPGFMQTKKMVIVR